MTVDDFTRRTYEMVLELHKEWPEFKGAVLRLERRVTVLEEARRRPYGSTPPPSIEELEHYRSDRSGAYHLPAHVLSEALAQRDKAEKADKWDAALRFLGKWALAVAGTVGGAYLIHLLWN